MFISASWFGEQSAAGKQTSEVMRPLRKSTHKVFIRIRSSKT
jgi:hypothetical protein